VSIVTEDKQVYAVLMMLHYCQMKTIVLIY